MEVFAGYSENADWNVGRLLDSIEEMGDLDNTLIIYIWGDNGASMEGTITGSFNEMTFLNGVVLDAEQQLELIEKFGGIEALGGVHTAPHYAAAWAWASNTPFQWGKQTGSHLGGTRDPMVVAWPERIKADARDRDRSSRTASTSARRSSSSRASPSRESVDGIAQEPMDGTSFAYTFDDAEAEERHTVQYFEMLWEPRHLQGRLVGVRQARQDPVGLLARDASRSSRPGLYDPEQDTWELYYLPDDFSQAHDLAAEQPREARRAQGAVLAGGRAQQGAAAARRASRHSSACCRRCRPSRASTSPVTSRTSSAR